MRLNRLFGDRHRDAGRAIGRDADERGEATGLSVVPDGAGDGLAGDQ